MDFKTRVSEAISQPALLDSLMVYVNALQESAEAIQEAWTRPAGRASTYRYSTARWCAWASR
jgi:hypothetical protein